MTSELFVERSTQLRHVMIFTKNCNDLELETSRSNYDVRKCNFTIAWVTIWNSL